MYLNKQVHTGQNSHLTNIWTASNPTETFVNRRSYVTAPSPGTFIKPAPNTVIPVLPAIIKVLAVKLAITRFVRSSTWIFSEDATRLAAVGNV